MECPVCQTELPVGANFCFNCGHALGEKVRSKESGYIPDAERKRITALFSDLSGYTAITEEFDPEDVKKITSGIFDGVRGIVAKYEGFIERFAGDGVLALFGIPQTHEDDPVRAVRAALEIHEFVRVLSPRYEKKLSRSLAMHSGINTGLAVTADVNPEKGTHGVTGDAINVAARLSDFASAGEIIVGSETYKATQYHFKYQTLKPTAAKGKSEPIQAYKFIPDKIVSAVAHHRARLSSEMVGRDQELAKLELHILKAVNGQGSIVNVFGEPGIGKSRLLAELRKRDVVTRVSFLEGRSISIGKNLSFYPIIDLFKNWSKIKDDDSKTEASNKLENAIRSVCKDDVDEVFPFVATMMGMKLSGNYGQRIEGIEGEALERLIFKNIKELLILSTELIPIVIVMEDLHWADSTSLKLLESLFRMAQTYRVVFINIFRTGYWQQNDRNIENLAHWLPEVDFAEISLKPLNKQTGELLIDNMLRIKGLKHAIKHQIIDRAGGNPFFIEEVLRSFIDEKAIIRTNGVFEVTNRINQIVIPTTINDVILARIDRLEDQTRELIKIASVIGRSFFYRILKEVAASIDAVDDRLIYLKDSEFIRERIRMEELEYLFKHALAQETAYESTLLQHRKKLHKRVAKAIENIFVERLHEFYGMLAFHYSKAEDLDKSEEYMMKAGEEALRSSASSEALHYFQQALKLYLTHHKDDADPCKIVNFEKNIALAFYSKALWIEAVEYFNKVLERLANPIPKSDMAGFIIGIWDLLVLLKVIYLRRPKSKRVPKDRDNEIFDLFYKTGQALAYIDHTRLFIGGLRLMRLTTKYDLYKIPRLSTYWLATSAVFSFSGISFKISNKLLEITKDYVVPDDNWSRMNHAFLGSTIHQCQGTWDEVEDLDENLLRDSLKFGDLYQPSLFLWFYGLVKSEQGEFSQLIKAIDLLYEIGETYDYSQAISNALSLKADYFIKLRKSHEAVVESEKGVSYSQEKDIEVYELMFLGFKAEAQQQTGDMQGARDSILQASRVYETQPLVVMPLFVAPYTTACLSISIIELKKAILSKTSSDITHGKKRVESFRKMAIKKINKYAPYRTKNYRLMGNYYWILGKQGKALKWWARSIKEGEKLGARLDLSRSYFEIGKRLLDPRSKYKKLNGINAKGYMEKAGVLFKEMDLKKDLEEMHKILPV